MIGSLKFLYYNLPFLLIAYYNPLCKSRKYKNVILLLVGIALYASVEPDYLILLLCSIVFNYSMVCLERRKKAHFWGDLAIIVNVFVLLFLKYAMALMLLHEDEYSVMRNVILPLGISYYTFRAISFVIEYRKAGYPKVEVTEVALYISNFMCITSGPIGFFDLECQQIRERTENKSFFYMGIDRIAIGMIKKIFIADAIQPLVDFCFQQSEQGILMAWIGAVAFSIQLYFDFSGYTDMAIGIGNLFGFELPENFNFPYMATSVCDFWKRWHISLTKWFTRYIYIPLGGARTGSVMRHICNLGIVWICTGIWHGINLTFMVWAMVYFMLQIIEKYTSFIEIMKKMHLRRIYLVLVVVLLWVVFRAESVSHAFSYIGNMFGAGCTGWINENEMQKVGEFLVPLGAGILFSTSLSERLKKLEDNNVIVAACIALIKVLLFFRITMVGGGSQASLYAGF